MKDRIDNMNEKVNQDRTPIAHLSVMNIEQKVEEGEGLRGSFIIESDNGIPIRGHVHSTNEKMEPGIQKFDGLRQEISYYFHGDMCISGEEYTGDFVFVTNAGEFNIPFEIVICPRSVETSIGEISNIDEFTQLYMEDPKEAKELFYQTNFPQVFLKEQPERKFIYHSLMKSRNKNIIMEEFLSACGCKDVPKISVEKKQIVLDAGKNKDIIELHIASPGYLEGTVSSEKGQVGLSVSQFCSDDFTDGVLVVTVEKNQNYAMGTDVICIETVRQNFEIPVEWWGTLPTVSKEKEQYHRVNKQRAELMHNYLYFRTGSIGFEDFAEDSQQALDDLFYMTNAFEWKLYKLHIALMQEQTPYAEELLKELEEVEQNGALSELESNYYLYLKAMFYRTPETISEAVVSIRNFYESTDYKAEALWMLIYIDREYVYNKQLQYDTIKALFEQGCNSCLLYFEACDILNDHPGYMDSTGKFEVSIFRWGVRYGYISMSLAYQFARLALRVKYFSNSIFHIAQKLYQVEPDERFLQVICSLLIKGNRTGKEFHPYFLKAVEENLKIIGLNEFFIRSMNFNEYEKIPQRVLIYFTYSNSLDSTERAYLYTNVLKNKDAYEEVFGAYYSKMIPFVEEQLLKGKMNENLAFLYSCFQEEILEKPENAKAVCDILFYRKLTCKNKHMIGLYVSTPENGQEKYYPLSGGMAYIETYNQRTKYYFVDSREQRYVKEIDKQEESFLKLSQFPEEWIRKNIGNKKLLLMFSGHIGKQMSEDDLNATQKIISNPEYKEWMKAYAIEQLLIYYGNHQKKEELDRWLDRADYDEVPQSFRKRLLDFYMEVGMMEHAFHGIERYGTHIIGVAKRLRLANFGIEFVEWKKDPTVLALCYSAFVQRKYNKDTLIYLMEYFEGELEDLLLIWERSTKLELETTEFEQKILKQGIFTNNDTESIYPVFSSLYRFLQQKEGDYTEIERTIGAYLDFASLKELQGTMELTEEMHQAIGQEILSGRIRERKTKIYFLYYFAGKTGWYEKIKDAVLYIIHEFLEEELYLPVYHEYEAWLTLPVAYQEFTFLTYQGGIGRTVTLYYEIEGEEEYGQEKTLEEVLPGMYVCHMHFFRNDHVNYRLEEDGEKVHEDSEKVKFETFRYHGNDSRFFELNHLSWEENGMENLKTYLMKSYFADHYMKLL